MTPRLLAGELALPWLDDIYSLIPAEGGLSFSSAGADEIRTGYINSPAVLLVGEAGWLRIPTLKDKLAVRQKRAAVEREKLPPVCDEFPERIEKKEYGRNCVLLSGDIDRQAEECARLINEQSCDVMATEEDHRLKPVYGGLMTAVFRKAAPPLLPVYPEAWPAKYQTRPDISEKGLSGAKIVVVAGRGTGNSAAPEEIALKIGAEIGATRAAVLNGWYPVTRQIGVSGTQLNAGCTLVLGASGAPAFMSALSRCGLIIAVNNDPAAPIFQCADYGIVSDCSEFAAAFSKVIGG